MKKKYVYVVWSIPDYIGIDIEGIFDSLVKAEAFAEAHNKTAPLYDQYSVDVYEVL